MPQKKQDLRSHVVKHKDGSIWARGRMAAGDVPSGYWEWFRKDGTKLRSGTFDRGIQVGEWTTYDKAGAVYKVTKMKPKPSPPSSIEGCSKAAICSVPAHSPTPARN